MVFLKIYRNFPAFSLPFSDADTLTVPRFPNNDYPELYMVKQDPAGDVGKRCPCNTSRSGAAADGLWKSSNGHDKNAYSGIK